MIRMKVPDGEDPPGCECPPRCLYTWEVIIDCRDPETVIVETVTQADQECTSDVSSSLSEAWVYYQEAPPAETPPFDANDCKHILRKYTREGCCVSTCDDSLLPPDPPTAEEATAIITGAGKICPNDESVWWELWSAFAFCPELWDPPHPGIEFETPAFLGFYCGTATEPYPGFLVGGESGGCDVPPGVAEEWQYYLCASCFERPEELYPCWLYLSYWHKTTTNCCQPVPSQAGYPALATAVLPGACEGCTIDWCS